MRIQSTWCFTAGLVLGFAILAQSRFLRTDGDDELQTSIRELRKGVKWRVSKDYPISYNWNRTIRDVTLITRKKLAKVGRGWFLALRHERQAIVECKTKRCRRRGSKYKSFNTTYEVFAVKPPTDYELQCDSGDRKLYQRYQNATARILRRRRKGRKKNRNKRDLKEFFVVTASAKGIQTEFVDKIDLDCLPPVTAPPVTAPPTPAPTVPCNWAKVVAMCDDQLQMTKLKSPYDQHTAEAIPLTDANNWATEKVVNITYSPGDMLSFICTDISVLGAFNAYVETCKGKTYMLSNADQTMVATDPHDMEEVPEGEFYAVGLNGKNLRDVGTYREHWSDENVPVNDVNPQMQKHMDMPTLWAGYEVPSTTTFNFVFPTGRR
uniref:Uncharacterized protein n=1 Tax=Mucochytrium quahogii TaxID=96639 RepID=A0A7S2S9K4_9STRA|mmetsp:Transcript_590/g.1007  ORF Transcript_590/g.1007 Transcript_590/m.1007 type:complete len:379 (+) Transcript_590:240-1376(+)